MSSQRDPESVAALGEPDTTTLHFTPLGLSTAGLLRPEDSLAYLRQSIEPARLPSHVPTEIQTAFERLRRLHLHGLFSYGFFTIVAETAWLLPEAALGTRFVDQ